MIKQKKIRRSSFLDSLQHVLDLTKRSKEIKIKRIFEVLSGKGYAVLLIILSLPFCIPIQIPGFSTPFGILLAFIGFRVAFFKRLWWPKWILEKSFSSHQIGKLIHKTMRVAKALQKVIKPRLQLFTNTLLFKRLNGLLIFILAILLSLPLPIPLTNILAALPIFCIGLGLLGDDGVFILIGYFFALLCFSVFFVAILLGKAWLSQLSPA